MRNSAITDFFQTIKSEPDFGTEPFDANTFSEYDTAIKDEPEYYIKEELDVQYEIDNTDLDSSSRACTDFDSLNCTVVIERLSDSDLQKYLRKVIKTVETLSRSDNFINLDVENEGNYDTNSKQKEIVENNVNKKVRNEERVKTIKRSVKYTSIDVINVENSDTNSKQKEIVENNVDKNVRNEERVETIQRSDSCTSIDVVNVENSDTISKQKEIYENNVDENVMYEERGEIIKRSDSSTSIDVVNVESSDANSTQKEIVENSVDKNVRYEQKVGTLKRSDSSTSIDVVNVESPDANNSKITTFFTYLSKDNFENTDTNNQQNETNGDHSTNKHKTRVKYKERDVIFNTKCYISLCPNCNKQYAAKTTLLECQDCGVRLFHQCKKCGKQLGSHLGIGHHIKRKCTDEGFYYECYECSYKSSIKYYVVNHVKRMHPKSLFFHRIKRIKSKQLQADLTAKIDECLKCGQKFGDLGTLMKHAQLCRDQKVKAAESQDDSKQLSSEYSDAKSMIMRYCTSCDEAISGNAVNAMQDKKLCIKCHIPLAYRCLVCQKPYQSCNGIVSHIVLYHTDRQELSCSKCDFRSTSLTYLTCHYKRMHNPNLYRCPRCRKLYKSQENLSRHMYICGKEPDLYCDNCSYKTIRRKYLKRHLSNVHPLEDTSLDCPKCNKVLKNIRCLKAHLWRVHTKKADVQCHHCSFKTKSKYHVTRHIFRFHMAGSKYECPRCRFQFQTNDLLKKHQGTCLIDRYIHCEICPYKTHKHKLLKDHIRNMHSKKKC